MSAGNADDDEAQVMRRKAKAANQRRYYQRYGNCSEYLALCLTLHRNKTTQQDKARIRATMYVHISIPHPIVHFWPENEESIPRLALQTSYLPPTSLPRMCSTKPLIFHHHRYLATYHHTQLQITDLFLSRLFLNGIRGVHAAGLLRYVDGLWI